MSTSELPRLLDVAPVLAGPPLEVAVEAAEEECDAIAQRLKIVAVSALSALVQAQKWKQGGVEISGTLNAAVTQTCVVSLEDFETLIEAPLEAFYLPEEQLSDQGDDDELFEAEDEVIEALTSTVIDLGELVVQHLALALDPHPRKPGIIFEQAENDDSPDTRKNPFSALKGLVDPKS